MRKTQMVRAALGLDAVSNYFTVRLDPACARHFASNCEWHGVAPRDLRNMIYRIDQIIPRMDYGPNNPNTGKVHHRYTVGKAYSRVLYLYVVKAYFPRGYDFEELKKHIAEIAKDYSPAECDTWSEDDGHVQMRFWWD